MTYNNKYGKPQFNGNRSGGNNSSREAKPDLSFTPDRVELQSFYTEKGEVIDTLFDSKAKEIASSFIGKDQYGKNCGLTSSQLRKIFDEVKRFEGNFGSNKESEWVKKKPYIKMIKSKVAYTIARNGAKKGVWKNFEYFISSCIDKVESEKDYHVFLSLFEAVYGFYYELAIDNGIKVK